jgi:hypothetical protein
MRYHRQITGGVRREVENSEEDAKQEIPATVS